jgi:cyclopropane-fatty-acyl-phospholipid synthase
VRERAGRVGIAMMTPRASVAAEVEPLLASVARGKLALRTFGLRFWDGSELRAPDGASAPTLVVRDPLALAYVLREPNQLGLGRAWVAGCLDVEGDLDQLLALRHELKDLHLSALDKLRAARAAWRLVGSAALRRPPALESEARLGGRRDSLGRDDTAVRHHYDVPEAFYRLILGPTMVYSCAYFDSHDNSLADAQQRKLELICHKLRLQPGDRLLDVGCGWGSLVLHAAQRYGVRAVGVTVSPAQAEVARDRVRAAGLQDACEIRIADYREVADGPYDAIASVGMYEHVGRAQLGVYTRKLADLLRPGGLLLNHGIARLTPGPGHERTFIARFVFPDGELHPLAELLFAMQDNGLEIWDVESLREHYVLTLRKWLANLAAHRDEAIGAAGEQRERIWRLYMTASAIGFEDGEISVFQTLGRKPGATDRLPLVRTGIPMSAAPALSETR